MTEDTITLHIYRGINGQWFGKLVAAGEEIGAIAGCEFAGDVERQAIDCGLSPEYIQIEA